MKTAKRLLAILLSVLLIVAMTACSSKETTPPAAQTDSTGDAIQTAPAIEASGDAVELTFWAGLTGADLNAMQGMVDAFNASQSAIKVNFYSISWSEIFSKFEASFNTDNGPDVMLMHVTDVPNYGGRDMLSDVSEIAAAAGVKGEDYPASVWNGAFYNGTQYAIPWDYHNMCVYVNNSLFEAAGLDPAAEITSEEQFLAICDALKASGVYPISLSASYAHTYRYWYGLLYQFGGSFCDDAFTTASFNSEAGVKAMEFLAKIVDNEYCPTNETDIDADWLSGQTAMVIEGPWFTPTAVQAGFEFTTVAFPTIGDSAAVWGSSHTLTVPRFDNRSAEKTEAINTFLSYFVEHSYEWGATSGQIPANNAVSASDAYKACDFYPYQVSFIESSTGVHYEPLCVADSEFGADNTLSPVMAAITNCLSDTSVDFMAELDAAAASVNDIFSEYQ